MDKETLKKFISYLEKLRNDYSIVKDSNLKLAEQNKKLMNDYESAIGIINNFNKEKEEMVKKIKEIENFKTEFVGLYKENLENNDLKKNELEKMILALKKENENLKNNQTNNLNDEENQMLKKLQEENNLLKETLKNQENNNDDENNNQEEFENIVVEIEKYKKEVEILTNENNELTKKIGLNLNEEEEN